MEDIGTLAAFVIIVIACCMVMLGVTYYVLYPMYISKFKYAREARFILKRALHVYKIGSVIHANINLMAIDPNFAIISTNNNRTYNIRCPGRGKDALELDSRLSEYFPDVKLDGWTIDGRKSSVYKTYLSTDCENYKSKLDDLEKGALKLISMAIYVEQYMAKRRRNKNNNDDPMHAQRYISERYGK